MSRSNHPTLRRKTLRPACEPLEDRRMLAVSFSFIFSEAAAESTVVPPAVIAAVTQIQPFLQLFTDVVEQRQGEPIDDIFIPIVVDIQDLSGGLFTTEIRGNTADYGFLRQAMLRDATNELDDSVVGNLPLPHQLQVEARYPFFWNQQVTVTKSQLRGLSAWPPVLDLQYEPFLVDDAEVLADAALIFGTDFDGSVDLSGAVIAALVQNMGFGSSVGLIPTNPGLGQNGFVPIPTADLYRFADDLPGKDPENLVEFQTFPRSISPSVPGIYDDGSLELALTGVFLLDILTIGRVLDLIGWDIDLNLPPDPSNDNFNVQEDTPTLLNILGNDDDLDGQLVPSSILFTDLPDFGTVSLDPATGLVLYTPFANYNGPDSFVYSISDNDFKRATATVFINVVPVNDLPVAGNDSATTPVNTAVLIPVLANDSDLDGTLNPLTVQLVTTPANGSAQVQPSGEILYTPSLGFVGGDVFEYVVRDNQNGQTNTARVIIRVGNPVQLAGQVYVDLNNNGIRDPNELGIAGVNVVLNKTDGPYTFTGLVATTDANGQYVFTEVDGGPVLPAGRYTLVEVHPPAFFDGQDTPGAPAPLDPPFNDAFGGIVLGAGGAAVGFNFGEGGIRAEAAAAGLANRFFLASDVGPNVLSAVIIGGPGANSGDGSNATFVANLYQEVLYRAGDAPGVAYWTSQLNTGALSRVEVASAFLNSYEYRANLIDSYFRKYLGRPIDAWGMGQFQAVMAAGWTERDVLALILRSDEYFARHGANFNNFVTSLYVDMLGRAAATAEVNQVKNASRQAVVDMVLASEEFGRLLLDGTPALGGWYDRYLNRHADTAGLNSFLSVMRAGWRWRDVQAFILGSDENFL